VFRSNKQNFGAIAMRQHERGDDPATNFFVGRYSKNFSDQNRIGGMMTLKNRPDGTNMVSTIDGFFRLSEAQSLNAFVMHSTGGQVDKQGFAGIAQYFNSTNNYKIWWTQSIVTKDFNPEMGFVARKDIIGTTPGMNWYYRGDLLPFKKVVRAFEPGFLPEFYWQASTGEFLERQLWFFPFWLNFQKGGYLGYSINSAFQNITEPFEPLGVRYEVGKYNYFQQQVWFSTDPSKFIYLWGQFDWGTYFDGKLAIADINLQFSPSPHFSLIGKMNRNKFQDAGLASVDRTVDLYGIEGRFALNPRLQLIGFYQQNAYDDSKNYNIRLAWEYRPLSYVYIVWNKNGFNDSMNIRQKEDHAIVKLSYLWQL
jgi:hypothetical protein